MKQKFSKDPKVELFSIEDFFNDCKYFHDIMQIWKDNEKPNSKIYYKITPKFLISIYYYSTTENYGMDPIWQLMKIKVSYRNGKTEFELLDKKIKSLLTLSNQNSEVNQQIKNLKRVKSLLIKNQYDKIIIPEQKSFEQHIINVNYTTNIESLKNKYVVFDVETNGTRKANSDLLSISIFDPSSGKCYNRLLPLELQPLVLTGWINGLTDSDLENTTHLTQEEINKIIDYFDLKNKTLLSFSGGKGTFDFDFIINYCNRHDLVGFENLSYENIKSCITSPKFGTEGQLTKDNLCRLLRIDGVSDIHSSLNDCLLEWQLFEKLKTNKFFFINNEMYNYHEGYIVPITKLNKSPELEKIANITIPNITSKSECIFEYNLPKHVIKKVKKLGTNDIGIALEEKITHDLNAKKQNNKAFLLKNKSNLEYVGELNNRLTEIPITVNANGLLNPLNPRHTNIVTEINEVTKLITKNIEPVILFIKSNIFTTEKIISQELVISNDGKLLALCDLSDKNSILEIKTKDIIFDHNNQLLDPISRQLYYQNKGRKTFILQIKIKQDNHFKTDAVTFIIYKVELKATL